MKRALEPTKPTQGIPNPASVIASLPFYESTYRRRRWVHRVRSGLVHHHVGSHWRGDWHVSYRMWCGQVGFSTHGQLLGSVPDGVEVCPECDRRAS